MQNPLPMNIYFAYHHCKYQAATSISENVMATNWMQIKHFVVNFHPASFLNCLCTVLIRHNDGIPGCTGVHQPWEELGPDHCR